MLRNLGTVHHAAGAAGVADGEYRIPLVQVIAGNHLQMGIGVDCGIQAQPQQLVV